ncbi:MAG: TatD family hydrolase [Bacteroidia bacterium]|nr:TatD family hydrolase [Bacteroidia bacterium]
MIDTHTHIYGSEFVQDIDLVVSRAKEANCKHIILPATNENSIEEVAKLCAKYPDICKAMYGLHPTDIEIERWEEQLDNIVSRIEMERGEIIGVGEIGLDLHYGDETIGAQRVAFERQLVLARDLDLPVSMHIRDAYEEFWPIISRFGEDEIRGSLHCFSGSLEDAQRALEMFPKLVLGVGGTLTYKKSTLPEIFKHIPLERVVIETDAPYLAPVPLRGKRNEPAYLTHVIDMLSDIYEKSCSEIERITDENACRVFALK